MQARSQRTKQQLLSFSPRLLSDLHRPYREVRGGRRGWPAALRGRADLRGRYRRGGEVPSAGSAADATGSQAGPRQPDSEAQDWFRR